MYVRQSRASELNFFLDNQLAGLCVHSPYSEFYSDSKLAGRILWLGTYRAALDASNVSITGGHTYFR